MNSQLELRYQPDTDGTGELFARARSGDFLGAGSAWFSEAELLAFGTRLQTCYPLTPGTELQIQGGYWAPNSSPPRLQEVLLGLRVYALGITGGVGLQVELADPIHEHQRPESRGRACFELATSYDELQRFGAQIQSLLRPGDRTARLSLDRA
ncbi:MAG: hypothetical protein DI603_04665 [Roseateles depolymerans]|uniref:Uncharacterized protein n=1 Tax=Roseateles depolymerans TaxID=76731 RepID=A0A2W5DTG3_9BURK|nr:MAG: hypothetical protein DI603_04665 [Roseateles depolymerans]